MIRVDTAECVYAPSRIAALLIARAKDQKTLRNACCALSKFAQVQTMGSWTFVLCFVSSSIPGNAMIANESGSPCPIVTTSPQWCGWDDKYMTH